MQLKKNLISSRYKNDGQPLVILDDEQKKTLRMFLDDPSIKYTTVIACPLCAHENATLIAEKERYGIPLNTAVCDNCGLIRSYQQMDETSSYLFYSKYYRKIYEPLTAQIIDQRYKWAKKRKIPRYVAKDKIILEIGCGGGWNLVPFHLNNYTHYGFDFDEKFIEYGKKQGLNLYTGGVEEIKQKGITADYVLIDNVLEHVSNPAVFLQSVKPILRKNAIINIYVPSLNLIPWGYSDGDLLATLQNAHNFLFDEFTLRTLGTSSGFKILNCLATNLVLEYANNYSSKPSSYLAHINRGKKIINSIKFAEKVLGFKNHIPLNNKILKKFYSFINPLGAYRRFKMDYLGKLH